EDDALVRQFIGGVAENEAPFLPAEERIDDLEGLILHAPPEILRRDGAHLHEEFAVARLRGDAALRFLVLGLRDLAVAQQVHAAGAPPFATSRLRGVLTTKLARLATFF